MIRLALMLALMLAMAGGSARGAEALPEAHTRVGNPRAADALRVAGTTDVAVFAPVLSAFAATVPELAIDYEQWASNDLYAVAAAACRGERPSLDLIINSAVDQQVKLVNDGCARPHRSVATAALPAEANWRDELFGVTREPAVMVYNNDLVPAWEAPRSRFDLIDLLRPADSRFAGRVATYDIEESGLGYLFAFADAQQATTFGGLLEALGRGRAVATCCSVEIIDGVAAGTYLIAYNVLGSYALDRAREDPRISVVAPEDYTLVLSRAAMIPKDAPNPAGAGLLIDFLLSEPGRAALAARNLIVRGAAVSGLPEDDASLYRPIRLSPVLLLGLDSQMRASFMARWRTTFPRAR